MANMSEQLTKLESAIEDTSKEGGAKAAAIAEKGRELLTLGRDLAHDIAQVTRRTVSSTARDAYHRAHDTAQYEVEVARETVRAHPLLAVAGVAAVSALVACLLTAAVSRRNHRY